MRVGLTIGVLILLVIVLVVAWWATSDNGDHNP
jgi:hypothetical protein